MPRPATRSKFVSPKLSASLDRSGFWDRLCTIKVIDTEDRDSFGEPNPEMTTVYLDVPSRISPQTKAGAGSDIEKESSAGTIVKTLFVVLLDGYYPLITEDCVVWMSGEVKSFDVENVEHSSESSFTRLFLERIEGKQEGEA